MIPRVFVSSTYYDLKYVRERLEIFIENYGFEAILFESDKVTYQHGKAIDQSAYFEVELCHLMILIIGGRYGSPSTIANIDEERRKYDEEFISITRTEFETAIKKGIPILIFVDKNVYSEYQTYKENQDFFDQIYSSSNKEPKESKIFKFAHVDHINVFKFIDIVRTRAIKTFDKVEEIELYIKSQLSGMFYLYLESLKRKSDDNNILDTISELNNVTLRMNEMITSVGKEVLGKDQKEYEKVIESQLNILLDFFVEQFSTSILFDNEFSDETLETIDTNKITNIIYETILNVEIPSLPKGTLMERLRHNKEITNSMLLSFKKELYIINEDIKLKDFNIRKVNRVFNEKVKPFIVNTKIETQLKFMLQRVINSKLSELPF